MSDPHGAGKSIVILGAGIAGLATASALQEHLRGQDTITLVDREPAHVQGLSLLWVLRGWRSAEQATVEPGGPAMKGLTLLRAEVTAIETATQTVRTTGGDLRHDALVIALGAELNPGRLPGLPAALASGVAGEFYTLAGAQQVHDTLREMRSGKLAFLVASMPFKCPAAPYEGALLVADLLRETGVRDQVTVDVFTPEPAPMPVAGPVVGAALVAMLAEHGIGFHPAHTVERIDAAQRSLVFADGSTETFDYLVVVPPHQAPAVVTAAAFSPTGWIPVDPVTLASAVPGVWALGDSSLVTLVNGKPLPKAAVFAKGQAVAVAAGVARHLGYDTPQSGFTGYGACYVEVGAGVAAKGAGNFYHPDGPQVALAEPSKEFHLEKEADEAQWLDRWANA